MDGFGGMVRIISSVCKDVDGIGAAKLGRDWYSELDLSSWIDV